MPIFYSHASFSQHLETVNSKRKIKPDDSGFQKVVHDVVVKIKYDAKHLKKKKNYYYVTTREQLELVKQKLKEVDIEIEYMEFKDYIRINKK